MQEAPRLHNASPNKGEMCATIQVRDTLFLASLGLYPRLRLICFLRPLFQEHRSPIISFSWNISLLWLLQDMTLTLFCLVDLRLSQT